MQQLHGEEGKWTFFEERTIKRIKANKVRRKARAGRELKQAHGLDNLMLCGIWPRLCQTFAVVIDLASTACPYFGNRVPKM